MQKSKVAILTNFMEFNSGYSLTGITQDQCRMLQDNGHPVKLFVNSQYKAMNNDEFQFTHNVSTELPSVELCRSIPFSHLVDYSSIKNLSDHHKEIAKQTEEMLLKELEGVSFVFTHDFIFTGWFLPYGLGVIQAARKLPHIKFYHWVHSTPSAASDWWDFNTWGPNHKIIFPNKTEQVRVAEQYRTLPENVACIHHIKDLRTWYNFDIDSNDFIRQYPQMLSADIVKVYPISSDRLGAKGLHIVFDLFSRFKANGFSVFLVIANQWATGRARKEDIASYIEIAEKVGLENNVDFTFTSFWEKGKYDTGIHKRMLRDLSTCANMFIFPTREESFGLIAVEIPLTTAAITITNKSLSMMNELHGYLTDNYSFGSFEINFTCSNHDKYFHDIATLILGALRRNQVVLHRTHLRQKYNWDYLYTHQYLPYLTSNT